MAFRKLDLKERHENFCPYPLNWEDPVIVTEKTMNGAVLRVDSFVSTKSCKDISKEQLDPNLVTLEGMMEAGVTLDPTVVMHMLDKTDLSEILDKSSVMSENLYKYLLDNDLIQEDEK